MTDSTEAPIRFAWGRARRSGAHRAAGSLAPGGADPSRAELAAADQQRDHASAEREAAAAARRRPSEAGRPVVGRGSDGPRGLAEARAHLAREISDHQAKLDRYASLIAAGKKPMGGPPVSIADSSRVQRARRVIQNAEQAEHLAQQQFTSSTAPTLPKAVTNTTDPQSRIMPTRGGFVQGYNTQGAITADATDGRSPTASQRVSATDTPGTPAVRPPRRDRHRSVLPPRPRHREQRNPRRRNSIQPPQAPPSNPGDRLTKLGGCPQHDERATLPGLHRVLTCSDSATGSTTSREGESCSVSVRSNFPARHRRAVPARELDVRCIEHLAPICTYISNADLSSAH